MGIGLLKEGDDAYCISHSRPFRAGFYERPFMCFYLYRRRTTEKVTIFSEKFLKIPPKTTFQNEKKPILLLDGLLFSATTFYLVNACLTCSAKARTRS